MSNYAPVYDPLNTDPPNDADREIDKTLFEFMGKNIKLETDEEMERRNYALAEVKRIFREWVRYVAVEVVHLPAEEAVDVGGKLYVSGSHRLGIREPGVDIDVVCVAPRFCSREHFFTSLKDRLLAHPEVSKLNAVESAFVPLISFHFGSIDFDLLFARLTENSVPEDVDIFDDRILRNVDQATEKSLNGPRVTDLVYDLVPEYHKANGDMNSNFLRVLRCVRRWAKVRGLYGNKLGYLGGVNFNILVAFVCQLYPNASPSSLLARFFRVLHTWNWPDPILLTQIRPNPPGEKLEVWSREMYPFHLMPIITPAYPSFNSSLSVTERTRAVMCAEIKKAYDIVTKIIREKGEGWGRLFQPSEFFVKYKYYLQCHIIAVGDDEKSESWTGFVESRLGRLPDYLQKLPFEPIHLYPVKHVTQKSAKSCSYFIGFNLDHTRIRDDKTINIEMVMNEFRSQELSRFNPGPGLEFEYEHLPWKKLPEEVFTAIGGRACAKMMRNLNETSGAIVPASSKKRNADEMSSTPSKGTTVVGTTPGATPSQEPGVKSESHPSTAPPPSTALAAPATGEKEGTERKSIRKRKLASTEGITSLGRSWAHSSTADIDKVKSTNKILPPSTEKITPHFIPQVTWKLNDVR
mmetsp:Transcript_26696/g.39666  ORF Transcript_26696/g.39666 Transcript_26696/m.39666 type:complete len:635 (-) Transcript_26696:59-1963(-)